MKLFHSKKKLCMNSRKGIMGEKKEINNNTNNNPATEQL